MHEREFGFLVIFYLLLLGAVTWIIHSVISVVMFMTDMFLYICHTLIFFESLLKIYLSRNRIEAIAIDGQ